MIRCTIWRNSTDDPKTKNKQENFQEEVEDQLTEIKRVSLVSEGMESLEKAWYKVSQRKWTLDSVEEVC